MNPESFKPSTLFEPENDVCVHISKVSDLLGKQTAVRMEANFNNRPQQARSMMMGPKADGVFPDNYICFNTDITSQYLKTLAPLGTNTFIGHRGTLGNVVDEKMKDFSNR